MFFQSFFMLMIVQPLAVASSIQGLIECADLNIGQSLSPVRIYAAPAARISDCSCPSSF